MPIVWQRRGRGEHRKLKVFNLTLQGNWEKEFRIVIEAERLEGALSLGSGLNQPTK
jgi:hypothetical protein